MLPCRFILINQQVFKGVLELECVPINDVLVLHINVHQFKGTLTESIVQSFDTNSSNRAFFSALPVEKIAMVELSLNQSEELYLYIQNMLNNLHQGRDLHQLTIMNMTLYLSADQIFKMNNFINQFITTYELVRMNLSVLQQQKQSNIIADVKSSDDIDDDTISNNEEEIDDNTFEIENDDKSEEISLLNDCLIMSPNVITTYFISKYISNILSNPKKEKIHFDFNKETVTIHMSPLIHQELIEMSDDHYTDLLNIISSFNYSHEEYITKLKLLVRHLIYIINHYTKDSSTYFITIKVIEFLILIYTIKLSPASLISNVGKVSGSVQAFKQSIEYLINYAVDHVIMNHIDQRQITHNKIIFKHYPSVEYFEEEYDTDSVRQLISKELYLIDVDREFFIKQVLDKSKEQNSKISLDKMKIVFSKSITINIDQILESEPLNNNSWLDYQKVIPQQKQFEHHTIITIEYLQLLQITNTPNISKNLLKDVNPIISKYYNIIVNQIFKELTVCDPKHSISTLNLLTTYIRPYLHTDASSKTELFLLYRIIIPHLHDVYNINKFIDYFH